MKKTLFIKNAAVLTATSVILRFAGVIYKIYLASAVKSEGLGLYGLVFSAYMFLSVFAVSGISTAVTRLVSDDISVSNGEKAGDILHSAIVKTESIAVLTSAFVFFFSDFLAKDIMGDSRLSLSLKALSISLCVIGVSSCYKGYFTAKANVLPNSVSQLLEQSVRIILSLIILKKLSFADISLKVAGIILADALSEISSFLFLYIFFKKDIKAKGKNSKNRKEASREIRRIAFPITLGKYIGTAIRTAENLIVPKKLALFSGDYALSLSQFGMIKGMALPILFFPSAILNSLSTLLLPEISSAAATKKSFVIKSTVKKSIKTTYLFGVIFGAVFFFAGSKIGIIIYKDETVGLLIKKLSVIVPFMYIDSLCDGLLKGLDQQNFVFFNSLADSVLRLFLILFTLKKTGLDGLIYIMYISNILTCSLSVIRLIKVSGVKILFLKDFLLPLLIAVFSSFCFNRLFEFIKNDILFVLCFSLCTVIFYVSALLFSGVADINDYI